MNPNDTPRKTAARRLRDLVKSRFTDFAAGRGFVRERGSTFFYPYRRSAARHDLIEVQFDKSFRPYFILNFGSVPAGGLIDGYGRHVHAVDLCIAHLPQRGRLNSRRRGFFEHWFEVRWPMWGGPEAAAERQIERLIALFPQVEDWFESHTVGRNLRMRVDPLGAPGARRKFMEERGTWPPPFWSEDDEAKSRT